MEQSVQSDLSRLRLSWAQIIPSDGIHSKLNSTVARWKQTLRMPMAERATNIPARHCASLRRSADFITTTPAFGFSVHIPEWDRRRSRTAKKSSLCRHSPQRKWD